MGALLGTQKAKPAPGPAPATAPARAGGNELSDKDRAKLELKTQRDKLKKYRAKTLQMIERQTEMAKQLALEGHRDRALLCLKRKRYQQTMLDNAEGMMNNLEEMIDQVEAAAFQAEVFQALKQGTETLKAINAQMDLDEIENLMLDTREAVEYQQRVSEAISGGISDMDQDEIDAELDAIAAEAIGFPKVPTTPLVAPVAAAGAAGDTGDSDPVSEPDEPVPAKATPARAQRVAAAAQ
eukprot:c39130_g1_i1.p1 GENE.c39130_g1_i1~~c39130_g1_i1.p1  ORF type:complete len:239 (+),score=44.57 c39130_g1_i1:89-805(+)